MESLERVDILDKAIACFDSARQNLLAGASYLYSIKKDELWRQHYDSYPAFLSDCRVSEGTASKLVRVFEHFIVRGGLSHAKLAGVDYEKLYMAIRYPGDTDKQLAAAQTLTRGELRHELKNPNDDCEHEPISICRRCHQKLV